MEKEIAFETYREKKPIFKITLKYPETFLKYNTINFLKNYRHFDSSLDFHSFNILFIYLLTVKN